MAETNKDPMLIAQDQVRGQTVLGQRAPLLQPVPKGQTPVVAPDGEVGLIDDTQLPQAQEGGYRLASQEELRHQQVKERYGDTIGQLTTAASNLVDVAALGAGKGLMYKGAQILGNSQQAEQVRQGLLDLDEANPTAKVIGQGLGFALPAAVTGGTSLLGEAAATGAAKLVGQGVLSTATKWAVGGGLDAALFGAGTAFTDTELGQDPTHLAEKMMAAAGKNFLFGAGLGGALGLGIGAVGKAGSLIAGKLPSSQQLAEDLIRSPLRMTEADARMAENMGLDAHRHASFMLEHPEIEAWAGKAKDVEDLVPIVKKIIGDEQSKIAEEIRLAETGFKAEGKTPDVGGMFDRFQSAVKDVEALPFHQDIAKKLNREVEDFGLKTGYYQHEQFTPEPFRPTKFEAKPFVGEEFQAPAKTNVSIREMMPFKTGEEARFFKKEAEAIAAEDAKHASLKATHEARQAMFKATHEERQAAALAKHEAQQAAALEAHVKEQTKLEKAAPRILRDPITGKPIPGVGKVSLTELEHFRDKFETLLFSESKAGAANKFAQELRNAHKIIEEELVKQVGPAYGKAVESKRAATLTAEMADSASKKSTGFGWGSAGAAMGLGFMGPKGLAFGLGAKLARERLPQFVASVLYRAQKLGAIKGVAGRVTDNITSATRTMARTGIKATSVTLSRDKEYERTSKQITDLAISPERIQSLTQDHVPGDIAPAIQRAYIDQNIKAIQYLQSIMPHGAQLIPILPGIATTKPTKAAKANWMKAVDVFYDPINAISSAVRKGQLSKEHVDALDAMYPSVAQEFRAQALTALGEAVKGKKMPTYQKRLQFGLLLRAETDATLNPAFIVAQQAITEMQPENEPYTGLEDGTKGGGSIGPSKQGRRTDIESGGGESSMDSEK